MTTTLDKTWKILVLLAVLSAAALPLVGPPAEAIPPCGRCQDGTFDSGSFQCAGAAMNCSECTVCAK